MAAARDLHIAPPHFYIITVSLPCYFRMIFRVIVTLISYIFCKRVFMKYSRHA